MTNIWHVLTKKKTLLWLIIKLLVFKSSLTFEVGDVISFYYYQFHAFLNFLKIFKFLKYFFMKSPFKTNQIKMYQISYWHFELTQKEEKFVLSLVMFFLFKISLLFLSYFSLWMFSTCQMLFRFNVLVCKYDTANVSLSGSERETILNNSKTIKSLFNGFLIC